MTDLRKFAHAMLSEDVDAIYDALFEPCRSCEYPHAKRCTALGCTARLCAECMKEHAGFHLHDDPATERVQ